MAGDKLRIGLMGLAGKPIPTVAGDICAPHQIIDILVTRLQKMGHKVTVFTGKDSTVDTLIEDCNLTSVWKFLGSEKENPISYTEKKVIYDLILSTQAINYYREKKIDLIHGHDARFNPFLFLQANVPVLYTIHGDMDANISSYDDYRIDLLKNSLFGFANITKKNIQFCQKRGLKNYGYVPTGIEIEKYPFNSDGREGLLLVGRMIAVKMIKEAINIATKLSEEITLIGPKGSRDEDIHYFKELEQGFFNRPNVKYIGYLPREDIVPYYQKAKVLLFPSKSEATPFGLLEAMATGLPAVASVVGGIPDVIKDGYDGCLVEGDNIELWIEKIKIASKIDPSLPRKKIIEEFSVEKMAQSYIRAYNNFLNETPQI